MNTPPKFILGYVEDTHPVCAGDFLITGEFQVDDQVYAAQFVITRDQGVSELRRVRRAAGQVARQQYQQLLAETEAPR